MHGIEMPTTIKNRKGRKRKSGRRQPDGRLAPQRPVDYRAMAAEWPDRRGLAKGLRTHERAGSALGRLSLEKVISEPEYEAGRRYSVIVGAYLAMAGAPHGLTGRGRGRDCQGDANCPPDTCICRYHTSRYMGAHEAIPSRAAHMAVNRVAIHDQALSEDDLVHLWDGLQALARHFGLTRKGKSFHG
jgi:hypothetical protein